MIKTIIFDLGGVLIDWNPDYVFKKLLPDAEVRDFFFKNICTYAWNVEQDAGRRVAEATALKCAEWPGWEQYIEAYYGQWPDMLGGPIHDTVDIFRQLKEERKYRLIALTNWSNETFPVALERYDFLQWFEGIVVSGDENTRKPFPDIYTILMSRYNVAPEEAIFIDDSLSNIEAGEALGIKGIHFTNPVDFKVQLEKILGT